MQIDAGFRLKDALSGNFNDWGYIRHNSGYICQHCQACLDGSSFNGKAIRNYHILATESGIQSPDKQQVLQAILSPPTPPFMLIFTFTRKKHIFFHAKVTTSADSVYVATDVCDISIVPSEFRKLYDTCMALYSAGFSRDEITYGHYRKWAKIDALEGFFELDDEVKPYRGTFILNFLREFLFREKEKTQ